MFISYIRTIILYLLLVVTIRVMGKRQIGELEPSEFVVAILIADLASVPMQDMGIPLLSGVIPILTVLALELIVSICSLRYLPFRRLLCGNPTVLMENGTILQKNLNKTRITVDELQQQLRSNGVLDLTTVHYAILETDGTISTILYAKDNPPTAKDMGVSVSQEALPITVISDGTVRHRELAQCGHDIPWLKGKLGSCPIENVFLMTVTKDDDVFLQEVEP
ncbi:MAG: DUF421 domain-containing protein [Eubacteriales bacterium]